MVMIFRGDDTDANGKKFIKLVINNPKKVQFSKVLFSINHGEIVIPFTNEDNFAQERIELSINLNSKETAKLKNYNTGHIVTYDMNKKQHTCKQFIEFDSRGSVLAKWKK